MDKVLVTGASGYIALHCISELLKNGYSVRGSLRSPNRESQVRNAISNEVEAKHNLEFCKLDVTSNAGWEAAMEGYTYLLHVAAPFQFEEHKEEDEVSTQAR